MYLSFWAMIFNLWCVVTFIGISYVNSLEDHTHIGTPETKTSLLNFPPLSLLFELWPPLFSLLFAPQWGHRRAEFPTVNGALSNCFLIISRACCETASAGTLARGLGSLPGEFCGARGACSVICHCKGLGEMAVFKWEDTVSSHNYNSPVFTDLFTEEARMVTHAVQDFSFPKPSFSLQRIQELSVVSLLK